MLRVGPGRAALHLLVASPWDDFFGSVRPSTRWGLLTRMLFLTHTDLGQQTQGHPRRGGSSDHKDKAVGLSGSQGDPSLG